MWKYTFDWERFDQMIQAAVDYYYEVITYNWIPFLFIFIFMVVFSFSVYIYQDWLGEEELEEMAQEWAEYEREIRRLLRVNPPNRFLPRYWFWRIRFWLNKWFGD